MIFIFFVIITTCFSNGVAVKRKLSTLLQSSASGSYESSDQLASESNSAQLPLKRKLSTFQPSSASGSSAKSSSASSSSSAAETVKDVLADFYLSNKLSAKDFQRSALAAHNSGASGIEDIAKCGNSGKAFKNLARDVMRNLLKQCSIPELFWWPVDVWDKTLNKRKEIQYPFLLPHEMLHSLVQKKTISFFTSLAEYPELESIRTNTCRQLSLREGFTAALGIHGDGVPFTKRESLEMISWNALSHPTADRFPFSGVSKAFLCKCGCKGRHTYNSILKVFAWSMGMLIVGTVSAFLPDGSRWSDCKRLMKPGLKLGFHALLLQCRGDWPFLRSLFGFPSWSSHSICWMCKATQENGDFPFVDTHTGAGWRTQRYKKGEFESEMRSNGIEISPLFTIAGFTIQCIMLDWLHVVDLGVGPDVIGCFFWEATAANRGLLSGNSREERVCSLFKLLTDFYKRMKPHSRLDNLTVDMIKNPNKAKPKLHCKGAECRHLIPFCFELSQTFKGESSYWKVIADMFEHFHKLVLIVAGDVPFVHEDAKAECLKFCILLSALRNLKIDSNVWQFKPKLHMLQELIEYQSFERGNPRHFWCYRDESWCGMWARAAHRRGGASNAGTIAERFLTRYRAMNPEDM